MSTIQIQLDPVALREATTQAIMGTLTPEMKSEIISKAINALLTPSTNSWDHKKSPLQIAFDQAVERVAHTVALEEIAKNEAVISKVKELAIQAAEKVLAMDANNLAGKMAQAFVSSIRRE